MTASTSTLTPADFLSLPKVLLHEHVDGGLRPQTLLELCAQRGISVPVSDAPALAQWMLNNANSGSLVRYLEGFGLTVAAMGTPENCERVAFEAAEDALADGCVLAEFRMAPLLLESQGMSGEAALEAMLAGLARSKLACGLIVCGMRMEDSANTERAATLAARYASQGVIGFDLAGPERGFPPSLHARSIAIAREAGLGFTCHAGEADIGGRVLEAASLGATRIGHGVLIASDDAEGLAAERMAQARELGLHFEVCPTSNVHTGAATSVATHPLKRMLDAGLSISVSTDNRLMSGVTMSGEMATVHRELSLDLTTLVALNRAGAQASFLPAAQRTTALATIDTWLRARA
ncbi:MAG: hypothetical protein RJA98_2639 [Pseudomonadota bacterium]|jgi:adenosine deaminase